jgi:murein tripeptide amidase MpaA
MDIHGDEALPGSFLEGCDGVPSWVAAHAKTYERFRESLSIRSADFQTVLGYAIVAPGEADLSMSANYVAASHGALAMTLEMPFKDHEANPDPEQGWSPGRAQRLAVACLETLTGMIDEIGAACAPARVNVAQTGMSGE